MALRTWAADANDVLALGDNAHDPCALRVDAARAWPTDAHDARMASRAWGADAHDACADAFGGMGNSCSCLLSRCLDWHGKLMLMAQQSRHSLACGADARVLDASEAWAAVAHDA